MLTLRSIWSRLWARWGLKGPNNSMQLLFVDAVELGLLGGEVDAEAAVHARGQPARLHPVVPRLLGGRDDQRVLLQVGRRAATSGRPARLST